MTFEMVFVLIYGAAIALSAVSLAQLRGFLSRTRGIASAVDLDRYKGVVRLQMYFALAGMGLLGAGLLTGIVLILRGGLRAFAIVLVVNLVVLGLGIYLKRLENQVRGLPATSDELALEYRRVSETWRKKALPDF